MRVVVIGAGAIGASCALALAEAGSDTRTLPLTVLKDSGSFQSALPRAARIEPLTVSARA